MQLDFAFLANVADYLQDGRLVIFGADIDGLQCPRLPALAPQLCLVAKFWVSPDEPTEGHTLSVDLTKPNGERAHLCANEPLQAVRNRSDTTGPSSAQAAVALVAGFDAAGTYRFHVIADGQEVKEVPFHVNVAPDPIAKNAEQIRQREIDHLRAEHQADFDRIESEMPALDELLSICSEPPPREWLDERWE